MTASPITTMDGAEAERAIGQILDFNAQGATFMGRTCPSTYETSTETPSEFFQDYRVDASTLNLPTRISRTDGGCMDIFDVGSERIVFTWGGYFLDASRLSTNRY